MNANYIDQKGDRDVHEKSNVRKITTKKKEKTVTRINTFNTDKRGEMRVADEMGEIGSDSRRYKQTRL